MIFFVPNSIIIGLPPRTSLKIYLIALVAISIAPVVIVQNSKRGVVFTQPETRVTENCDFVKYSLVEEI